MRSRRKLKTSTFLHVQLFLAKKNGAWLESDTEYMKRLKTGENSALITELTHTDLELLGDARLQEALKRMPDPSTDQIHVLVRVEQPIVQQDAKLIGKRTRVDDWFHDVAHSFQTKRRRVDNGEGGQDRNIRYFTMSDFPPLEHPHAKYPTVMERESSIVIFTELVRMVKDFFEDESDVNLVVTGNPGTGKSRFYLYCIFQLVCRQRFDVLELGSFELVLNCGSEFHLYQSDRNEFVQLDTAEVVALKAQKRVLRLIDGSSSILVGWKGVSVLFAAPGLVDMNSYTKVNSSKFIIPAWSLEELQNYNSLLSDRLKLPNDVLISRYNKFGGIPRSVITKSDRDESFELDTAIASFSPLDVISFGNNKPSEGAGIVNYRRFRILEMVPSESDFRANFQLAFLSNYIAEKVISRMSKESLQKLSQVIAADSEHTAALRRKMLLQLGDEAQWGPGNQS